MINCRQKKHPTSNKTKYPSKNNVFDNFSMLFLFIFSILVVLPYVSFLKPLQVSYTTGIIYRAIILSIVSIFFVVFLLIYKPKIHPIIWGLLGIYALSQILTIFISPNIKNIDVPKLTTAMGLAQVITIILSVLVYLTLLEKRQLNKKIVNILCLIMIIIGVLLCIYSYIFQHDAIYNTFNKEYGWNYDVTSIFTMKTEYGFILYVCTIFSLYYALINKRYWSYVFSIFFLINMFISRSKTSALCTSLTLLTIFVLHVVKSWTIYKKYWIITFLFCGLATISILLLTLLKIGWFSNFNYYVSQVILHDAYVVMVDRLHKWWLLIIALDNPFNIFFGYGERITPLVLSSCKCASIGDSIYLSNYGVGGIVKFCLYGFILSYVLLSTIKSKQIIEYKIIIIIIQLSFLIGGLFENDSIMGITMSGLFSSIIFYSCNNIIGIDK